MTALAALGGATAAIGLLLLVAGAVGTTNAPVRSFDWRQARRVIPRRFDTRRAALSVAVAIAAFAATGWPVAALLAVAGVIGLPRLLGGGRTAQARIARLQALADWTRRLADMLTAGTELEQALEASLRTVPAPLAAEVGRLVAGLRARRPLSDALRAFADDLDDATGDLVVAALLLAAERRGRGLARVLTGLATTVEEQVAMHRAVEADRAVPRTTARWVTAITLVVAAALVLLDRGYVAPFGTAAGEVVLAVIGLFFAGAFAWMHRLTNPAPVPRFLPAPVGARARRSTMSGTSLAVLGGAVAGRGVVVLAAGWWPARPDLVATLARLDAPVLARKAPRAAGPVGESSLGNWLVSRLARPGGLRMPRADLAMVGRTVEAHLVRKVAMAAYGLALPSALVAVLAVLGVRLPLVLPVSAAVGMAVLFFFVPDLVLKSEADEARARFRRAVGAYLDLVALERAADGGPADALERASRVGHGAAFVRINDVLARGRLGGVPPWLALSELARDTGVDELGDLADIIALAGDDGAAVYDTLVAKAATLRARSLADAEAQANSASERMTLPAVLLGFGFLLLVCYPALGRVLS